MEVTNDDILAAFEGKSAPKKPVTKASTHGGVSEAHIVALLEGKPAPESTDLLETSSTDDVIVRAAEGRERPEDDAHFAATLARMAIESYAESLARQYSWAMNKARQSARESFDRYVKDYGGKYSSRKALLESATGFLNRMARESKTPASSQQKSAPKKTQSKESHRRTVTIRESGRIEKVY